MKINSKHIIFFVALIITLISVASAADINDTTLSSDVTTSTTSPDTQQTDTNVITESNINHEIKNTQQTTKNVVQTENSSQTRNTTPTTYNLNNSNFDEYITVAGLNTVINNGDILNFTENISRTSTNYTVDKPININGNGFTLDLNTIYGYNLPSLDPTWIEFNHGASNSNITNLKFHNTQVFTTTASNITFDNINVTVENQGVGMYTGYFAMRNGVINITVKNSYFYAVNNTGCSAIAITLGENCTIDNNTVLGSGKVGNLIYLNTYNAGNNTNITQNKGNRITNNYVSCTNGENICWGITITGPRNVIENNTIYITEGQYGITTTWAGSYDNETDPEDTHNVSYYGNKYINNTVNGKFSTGNYSIVENNTINGKSIIYGSANVTNNIFLAGVDVYNNVRFHSNDATGQTVTIKKANSCFKDNVIGTLDLKSITTYNCGGNTINTYKPGNYQDYFIECNGSCPNCQSNINNQLLKKNAKNVKSDDGTDEGTEYSFSYDYQGNLAYYYVYNNGTLRFVVNVDKFIYVAYPAKINIDIDSLDVNINTIVIDLQKDASPSSCDEINNFKFNFNTNNKKNIDLIFEGNGHKITYKETCIDNFDLGSSFKSVTYRNLTLIFRNGDGDCPYGVIVPANVKMDNCKIDIDYSMMYDYQVIKLEENVLIENSEIDITVPLIKGKYATPGIVFSAENEGNTTLNNNVINLISYEKSHDNAPEDYPYSFIIDSPNFIFTNNEVIVRYVRPVLITSSNAIIENNTINSMDTEHTINITGDNNIVRYNTLTAGEKEGDATVIVTGENNIVEQNPYVEPGPSTVITENTYSEFFDDECLLRPEFNNTDLTVSGNINEKVFIIDGVNVTITNDGTATLTNCQFSVGNDATVVLDGIKINNTDMDAIVLESSGNIINNSEIIVTSAYPLHAVEIAEDGNIITNTIITATIASADVAYDKDYVGLPQSSALYISSNNNLLDNATVSVDGTSVAEGSYYPSIDAIDIQSTGKGVVIENNTITNSKVIATGSNYVYGINVGRAKDTTIENVNIDVDSDYYTNAIQLFDAVDIKIDGTIDSTAATQAYGVYATAMAVGTSSGIDLTGLNITVEAPDATGVLIEGASDVIIADATYDIKGGNTTAVNAHVDWMGNIPKNINITGMDINIDGTEDNSILYFGLCDGVTITECNIETTSGSEINFNKTSNAQVTNNYILIKDMMTGSFGNYAVITTENDTTVENNTPTSKLIDELNQQIEDLQNELDQLKAPKATTLTLDPVTDAKYNTNITITGTLVNEDSIGLYNQVVTLTIGDKTVDVTTKGGVFEYTTSFKTLEEQTVTATYAGTDKYNASEDTITFTLEKGDVIVTVDEIAETAYGDNVTITGKFTTSDGKAITNSNVKITINGKKYYAKTDKTGTYTLSVKTTTVGENTITAGYSGNTNYNAYETTATFNVKAADAVVTYEPISDVTLGDNVTITGTFTDANGKAVTNSNVKITINGKKYYAKTDSTGKYTLSVTTTKEGVNNVTIGYSGSAKYNAFETSTTFTVLKKA